MIRKFPIDGAPHAEVGVRIEPHVNPDHGQVCEIHARSGNTGLSTVLTMEAARQLLPELAVKLLSASVSVSQVRLTPVVEHDDIVDLWIGGSIVGCFRILTPHREPATFEALAAQQLGPSGLRAEWQICLYRPMTADEFTPIAVLWHWWLGADTSQRAAILSRRGK